MKNTVSVLFFLIFSFTSIAQKSYWQQDLRYIIDVRLNDNDHSLDGFLKLQYINHSPDTIKFIWFHIWPNAFKNDNTAFSEQLLKNGRTDFYFSNKEQRGYINRLDFRTENSTLKVEDHPQYIDVVKVNLLESLLPGAAVEITTPFHVKLPFNFSRGGHVRQSYQLTQWFPKPAVYDRDGWHPMPYLDQGEFYSEFGSFDVRITVPSNYVVAATGELQNADEISWLKSRSSFDQVEIIKKAPGFLKPSNTPKADNNIKSSSTTKTLQYKQDRIHDFAWFADKYFVVNHDTIKLASGRAVDAWSYYHPENKNVYKNSVAFVKDAVRFRSNLIGEYPYNVVSAVESAMGFPGGMEYPTITSITRMKDEQSLDEVIGHEVGHNWFYGILANNERIHPWLDEGINSYYDKRYTDWKYPGPNEFSLDETVLLNTLAQKRKDQAIETPSEIFTDYNYGLVAYYKTSLWMKELEKYLGREKLDAAMQTYFEQWKFRHTRPEDFLEVLEKVGGKDIARFKAALSEEHKIFPAPSAKKKIKPALFFGYKNTDSMHYINFLPAVGYNKYDGFMVGAIIHNYNLPPSNFQFVVAPLFGTSSNSLNGIGNAAYSKYSDGKLSRFDIGLTAARFSTLSGTDSNGMKVNGNFYKLAPFIRITFKEKHPLSTRERWLEFRTFLLGEKGFEYSMKQADSIFYPAEGEMAKRYLNQLTWSITDYRALYPFDVQLQLQQAQDFYRFNANANYFLNYPKGGGLAVRFFASKFGYIGGQSVSKEFATFQYQPKLTAVRGPEDYTYSNAFLGRNENDGLLSQQIMLRDGGLKLRTDLFQGLQGRSDNWIASMNFSTSIPSSILPKFIPLRIFFDFGTYAEAWESESETSRFLFVGGLQLSLFKNLLNVYAPIVYSKEFSNNLKTVPEENKFSRKISFSIDIHRLNLRKLVNNKFPL